MESTSCNKESSVFHYFCRPSTSSIQSSRSSLFVRKTMKNERIFAVILTIFVVTVNGRVYYLPSVEDNRYTDSSYPVPNEQSSRDLDLSFLAGESDEFGNKIRPVKKMYTVAVPQKPFIEVNKEALPIMRYKLVDAPVKTINSDDIIVAPESNRKIVKTNGNNKGEVILELRVIANHDSV